MFRVAHLLPLLFVTACSIATGLGSSTPSALSGGAAAHREPDGRVAYPGADLLTARRDPCTPARNHCLRPEAWFVGDPFHDDLAREGKVFQARPVFGFDDAWWTWQYAAEALPGPAYRTAPATAALAAGDLVIWFDDDYDHFPATEHEAQTSRHWMMGYVGAVDGAHVRTVGGRDVDLDRARAVVETR
ncbi:MAG: hypothetical protein H6708_21735 [Kofleriaceae bacterium]|nr:hypothetical protein [Myxococcales bacterium]MCB9563036.1 hypothetical protein [Kofleriaceae bacterium]